ncbi:MAG: branched-chain amino acid ABC transporter permease, partial [Nitrososphaerales archaeon]
MIPILHVDIIINGILMGAIYALIAVGLNMIYGVSKILNLAHGDLLTLGCVVTYLVYAHFGHTPLLALVVIIPLFFLLGGLVNNYFIRPLMRFGPERASASSVIVTLGLSFIIVDMVLFASAQAGISTFGVAYTMPSIEISGFYFSGVRLLSLVSILIITIILRLFVMKTFFGKKIRALSQNREAV